MTSKQEQALRDAAREIFNDYKRTKDFAWSHDASEVADKMDEIVANIGTPDPSLLDAIREARNALNFYASGLHYTEYFDVSVGHGSRKISIINERGEKADSALTTLNAILGD